MISSVRQIPEGEGYGDRLLDSQRWAGWWWGDSEHGPLRKSRQGHVPVETGGAREGTAKRLLKRGGKESKASGHWVGGERVPGRGSGNSQAEEGLCRPRLCSIQGAGLEKALVLLSKGEVREQERRKGCWKCPSQVKGWDRTQRSVVRRMR